MVHALVVADGSPPDRAALDAAWPGWSDGLGLVVAADGGALTAERFGVAIDMIVGDADSLGQEELARFRAMGIEVRLAAVAKDETDAELAILAAVSRGARRITIVGALGGPRFDHALANVWLLAHPGLADCEAVLLDPSARISLVRAPGPGGEPVRTALSGPAGALVSLLPLGDVVGITTQGLAYPLRDEPLPLGPARGISNVRLATEAAVTVRRGRLLIVEAPATLGR